MADFESYTRYAFIYAHPDDEVFTASIIHRLLNAGKDILTLYLTNGDFVSEATGKQREDEVKQSLSIIGVPANRYNMLGYSEHGLLTQADTVINAVKQEIKRFKPDCVVSHDYEGGHNAHDFASFCGHLAASAVNAAHWVFPAYHAPVSEQRWNQFIPARSTDYKLTLSQAERKLKQAVMEAHVSQEHYFETILSSADANDFLTREVLHFTNGSIDFLGKPTEPLGYEQPGTTDRFDELQAVIKRNV